ncbi:hypothetical protein [Klebsiella pneumoniae]|uniref:hypothetical protein n=1 Tax=Klebsiella pneumoniae TaxID=573 RepID=UPI001EF88A50|nr:hypothetical protein [Klebsiella pneumoniae]
MKEELLLLRKQLKMGHRISFAEAMLLQRAIDILVSKAGNLPVNDVTAGKLFTKGDVVTAESLTTINPAPTMELLPQNAESLTGNSPTQSDCCPAQNGVATAQSPIDHGYRPGCECSGCKATARICADLSANSPANPGCWCRTCRPVAINDMRFVVCPDCGNKRCPRANDHRNACTGSNEPGQEGSAYPAAPQEVKP